MKLSLTVVISTLVALSSAKKWRLCCCVGPRLDRYPGIACDVAATQKIADNSGGNYKMSRIAWRHKQGADPRGLGYMWSDETVAKNNDGFIGGDEMSGWCDTQKLGSRCFTPYWGNYNG